MIKPTIVLVLLSALLLTLTACSPEPPPQQQCETCEECEDCKPTFVTQYVNAENCTAEEIECESCPICHTCTNGTVEIEIQQSNNCTIIHETNSSYVLSLIRQLKNYEAMEERYINSSFYDKELNTTKRKLNQCNETLEELRELLE